MKKLSRRDKITRKLLKAIDTKCFIKKSVFNNIGFLKTARWNTIESRKIENKSSKTRLNNWCNENFNKKRVNKHSLYSRHTFLKFLRGGEIYGAQKSCW